MTNDSDILASLSDDPLLITAAEWFERLHNEELDADGLAQWQRWLAEHPDHKRAFDGYLAMWERMDSAATAAVPTMREMEADRYAGEISIAAWRAQNDSSKQYSHVRQPDVDATLPRIRSRAPVWSRAAIAACTLGAVSIALWHRGNDGATSTAEVFETRASEHREKQLSDGSELSLGAESLALVHFNSERREVVLERGEAFFEVAKDSRRPFTVRVGETTVTAIGTAFNVRKTGERVLVAVAEGVVEVQPLKDRDRGTPSTSQKRVAAGHRIDVDPSSPVPRITTVTPQSATAWRTGRLEYVSEPLKYVVADVSRYSPASITIGDPAVGELLITGTVLETDVDGWLRSLEEFLPIEVQRSANNAIVLVGRRTAR